MSDSPVPDTGMQPLPPQGGEQQTTPLAEAVPAAVPVMEVSVPEADSAAPSVEMTMPTVLPLVSVEPENKAIDLAVLKKGAKDFLTFVDDSKELFYSYLYHRTGSKALAATLMTELYLETLSRALSLWWFGSLSMRLLMDVADRAIAAGLKEQAADLDTQYVPSLVWLSDAERTSVGSLHENLWTLPPRQQRLLTLSILVGLSDERIATMLGERADTVKTDIAAAKDALVAVWQPPEELKSKLSSLVFEPALDIAAETSLRFSVVEKYSAMRLRKYQWVLVGGFFAVMSNLVVASVLAFAVVTQPSTSLQSVKREVAGLDALLLKRKLESLEVRRSLGASYNLTRGMAAQGVLEEVNALGLAAAADMTQAQVRGEEEVDQVINLLKRATTEATAFITAPHPLLSLAVSSASYVFKL